MITFREFLLVCEKKTDIPPNAVPGTYKEVDGVKTYTLAPYKGSLKPLGSEKKVTKALEKQGGIGGTAIKKVLKKVKKIKEDLDTRRQELKQRQLDQIQAQRQKVAKYQSDRKERLNQEYEKEKLKSEIKRELQTEQTPVMQPNLYNQLIARRQASQKSAQIRHVHSELGSEAQAQQSAKRARLKAIMSR